MPVTLIGIATLLHYLPIAPAHASPDGADWAIAADPEGCRSCHLGTADRANPDALSIDGLPNRPEAGKRYELTVILDDPAMKNAGFLLQVNAGGRPAGMLAASDENAETSGSAARSTWAGSFPDRPGRASWRLVWTAPADLQEPIEFDLWGNAGNDDLSPLGDQPYHRAWQLPASP